mmetsp:Transcript_26897/g.39790  ORF Transcript_26897/g.39790 Transcript_26897/m.39790 type:complete len:463 (+) Transcript_26897:106-1494(+)|eukprot:CAMPEP_0194230498 /NCGR_PEP_ID=MMETSP0156-20130528/44438_1 /TAXON_ID=33649 /ORGANISM="Thalassionema nitzschioides, Strain L26-B" /LENGTH=462 /DNA_ID=CAMNT_0038963087 /DNA_START=2844 /DNA_END=4232 /DNA_ORIENTATION=-
MSFWGFGGGKKVDDLPSAEATVPQTNLDQETPPVTKGPPPVENAYNHAIQQRPTQPIDEQQNPSSVNPLGFQIFLPKVEDEVDAEDKASSETEVGAENNLEDATPRGGNEEPEDGVESCYEKQNDINEIFGEVEVAMSEAEKSSTIPEQDENILNGAKESEESLKSASPGDEVISDVEKTSFENRLENGSHGRETEKGKKIGDDSAPAASPKTLAKIVSPLTQNRFNFLAQAPIAIPKLQENKTKRRYEHRAQVHETDCRLAGLQASVAKESMDRDVELRNILPSICRRVENISDQFIGSKFMMDNERTQILSIQKRLADVYTRTLQYKHETLNQLQFEEFESVYVDLIDNIRPSIKIEAAKTDKREIALFRKFESLTGTQMRRFVEESSARVAAGKLLEEQMKIEGLEETTGFLEQIRQLRRKLKEERESRKVNDAKVLQNVHKRCAALQRAVLEAAGDQL